MITNVSNAQVLSLLSPLVGSRSGNSSSLPFSPFYLPDAATSSPEASDIGSLFSDSLSLPPELLQLLQDFNSPDSAAGLVGSLLSGKPIDLLSGNTFSPEGLSGALSNSLASRFVTTALYASLQKQYSAFTSRDPLLQIVS